MVDYDEHVVISVCVLDWDSRSSGKHGMLRDPISYCYRSVKPGFEANPIFIGRHVDAHVRLLPTEHPTESDVYIRDLHVELWLMRKTGSALDDHFHANVNGALDIHKRDGMPLDMIWDYGIA